MKKSMLEMLEDITDPRKGNAIRHNLQDVLMIGILTIISNGNTYVDMELFGETHEELLKQFLELPSGIPSHDTFGDVFTKLNPKKLTEHFQKWRLELQEEMEAHTVAIDGKTIRGSRTRDKKASHIVTAFASDIKIVLGQLATEEKSNEITAIPQLLEMFCSKGKIITIDAMGTQKEIASKIISHEADYVLDVKGNQPTLHEDISLYIEAELLPQDKGNLKDKNQYERTIEKGHGRIETRECYIEPNIEWLKKRHDWAGLNGIGVIVSKREEIGKETTISKNFFIYSMKDAVASELLTIKRSHWAIENQLHWLLDVTFREDDSQVRLKNAVENLNILRKQALELMKRETSVKGSMRSKRLRCSYDVFYALKVVGVNGFS